MKIYSDISLIDASASISADQNTFVLVRGSDGTIRRAPLTVNGAAMNAGGNITTALSATLVGPSASGVNNLINSSSGTVTGSITNGTVWIVANDSSTPDPDGQAFIFVSQSTEFSPPRGKWYPLDTLNQTQADLRYVKLSSASTQAITSSLIISGSSTTFSSSLFWSGASNLGGAANNVLVLGTDGRLYITGAYSVGGGGGPGTPGGADTTIQFNDGGTAFSGSNNFVFNKGTNTTRLTGSLIVSSSSQIIGTTNITGSLIVSSSTNLIGTTNITGSLIVSNSLNTIGTGTITGSLIVSSSSNVIGTSRVTGSLIISSSSQIIGTETITGSLIVSSSSNVIGTSRVTGSLIVSNSFVSSGSSTLRDGLTTIQGDSSTTGNVLLVNNNTPTNILTISNNRTSSFNGNTFISGALVVSRSTDNTATIVGSGSINPLLNVLGSQGQLFSVYDTLSGSLFSVNDISGLPIIDVRSDNTTLIGSYQAPALHTTRRITTIVGNNIIYNGIPTSSYNAAIIDYNLTSASYAKVGSIMAAWSGSSLSTPNEYAVSQIVGANYPTMSLQISGANLIITASSAGANWVIKTIIRSI
jgi:hypothetical protein